MVLPTIIFAHCRQISGNTFKLITGSKAFYLKFVVISLLGLLHWHFGAFSRCIRLIYKSATTFDTIASSLEVFTAPVTFLALFAIHIDKKTTVAPINMSAIEWLFG